MAARLTCPVCDETSRMPARSPLEGAVAPGYLDDDAPGQSCLRCGGMWVARRDWGEFVRATEEKAPVVFDHDTALDPVGKRDSLVTRACPACRRVMVKQIFARHSGVQLDVCYHHGVWLDAGELRAVRQYIMKGGLQLSRGRASGRDDYARWEALWKMS